MSARGLFTATQAFSSRRTISSDNLEDMQEAIAVLSSNIPIHVSSNPVEGRPEEEEGEHFNVVFWCHPTCMTTTQEEQDAEDAEDDAEVEVMWKAATKINLTQVRKDVEAEEKRKKDDLRLKIIQSSQVRRSTADARSLAAAVKVHMTEENRKTRETSNT